MKKAICSIAASSALLLLTGAGCGAPTSNQTTINNTQVNQQINIVKPLENKITLRNSYKLDCKTKYYTAATIGGNIIKESTIKISEGHERDTMYIDNNSAKYFGSDYDVLQDDEFSLIIIRHYSVSGLTEVVSINKETGIGFDTKTLSAGLSGAPNSDTFILSCAQI